MTKEISIERLRALHFRHEQFPDGWFWYLEPDSNETGLRKKISCALGYPEDVDEDIADTIILQVDDALQNWQYVYDADVGSLSVEEAERVLSAIEN